MWSNVTYRTFHVICRIHSVRVSREALLRRERLNDHVNARDVWEYSCAHLLRTVCRVFALVPLQQQVANSIRYYFSSTCDASLCLYAMQSLSFFFVSSRDNGFPEAKFAKRLPPFSLHVHACFTAFPVLEPQLITSHGIVYAALRIGAVASITPANALMAAHDLVIALVL